MENPQNTLTGYQSNNINDNNFDDEYIDANIFHKKKRDYNIFVANPDVEEIPTFTYENERNLNNYKTCINDKNSIIEQYSRNYLEYMRKFENNRRKTPFGTPYSVYKELASPTNIKYSKNNANTNNFNLYKMNTNNLSVKQKNTNNYPLNFSCDNINLRTSQKNENNNNSIQENGYNIIGKNEITNPGYYFQRMNKDYYKYRMEQKSVLEYNRELMENKFHNKYKKEPDINPYNPIDNKPFEIGKSNLLHNPILNPVNDYNYNKYLEISALKKNKFNIPSVQIKKNLSVNKSVNNINNNNHNLIYDRDFSTLQNAGNQLLYNN